MKRRTYQEHEPVYAAVMTEHGIIYVEDFYLSTDHRGWLLGDEADRWDELAEAEDELVDGRIARIFH